MKTATRFSFVSLAFAALLHSSLLADEQADKIQALEKRVEQLEKLLQQRDAKAAAAPPGDAPKPAETPQSLPSLSIGASGFTLRSADTNFMLRFRGLLQLDSHWSDDDAIGDSFLVRRARPILEGTVFRDFDFLLTPELAGSSPSLRDAWVNYRYNEVLQLRIGKMKPPGNLERWQSAANLLFIERSPVSLLWPVRDVGVMLHGELWPGDKDTTKTLAASGLANYSVGLFNGTGDGRSAGNSDFDSDKTVAGRLFFHPLLKSRIELVRKLGVGVSGTYGEMSGDSGLPEDFGYAADVTADGPHWRVGPQAYWYWGPFGVIGEYAVSSQRLELQVAPFGSTRAENSAWAITASWLLTGEEGTFGYPTPKRTFDPANGGWGAFQLVARYSGLDIDDGLFPTFADPAELATSATVWGVGLNWFLNRNIRASFNYTHTDLKGGQSGSVADLGENAFLTRVQLAF
ncbi:MAG TPA: porin [Verrucomicrobiae bacterium]|nr:porin [Verrucomicrobiae bacterium]